MKEVASFLKPYRLAVVIALALMLTELTVELVQPLFMAKIVDDGILKRDLSAVVHWGLVMVGVSALAFAAGIINSFFAAHVSQSFGFDIRKVLFGKIQSFSFANYNQFSNSSFITRMTNDVSQVQNTIFMGLRIMLRAPLLVIGGAVMALAVNFTLSFILIVILPCLIFFLLWVMKRAGSMFRIVQEKLDTVNKVIQENLTNMRLIKAFLRNDYEVNRFQKANKDLKDQTISVLRFMEIMQPVLLFVMNVSILIILWAAHAGPSEVKVGEVVAIVNYSTRIISVLSMLSFIVSGFSRAKASSLRISEVLQTEVKLTDELAESSHQITEGKIEFRSVSFAYPDSAVKVLDDVSFTVNAGETMAVMGATGSGKSTLFNLIPRLYDLEKGAVYIDGFDIRTIKLEHLRRSIGMVPQESLLFTGTVKDNILWGKEDATMEEIIAAAKDAQIHDTILKLPHGYDTLISQKGVNLSGGQKQRISIARALVRKPKILLLDDSTSALDLKTERKLLQALMKYPCTTLIITQKILTAMAADQILLLENGKVLAKGRHDELIRSVPLYQKIYESQYGKDGIRHAQKSY